MTTLPPSESQSLLYLALYSREALPSPIPLEETRYHWALLIIPTPTSATTKATRIHARDYHSSPTTTRWLYEEIRVDALGTPKLLVKTLLSSIDNVDRVFEVLRDVPLVQDCWNWNCVQWVRRALDDLWEDGEGCVVRVGDWFGGGWNELKDSILGEADIESQSRMNSIKRRTTAS